MFNKKKQPAIKSLIADGSQITGNILFTDGLRIDGRVHGEIRANEAHTSLLVISESAQVTGSVTADHIIVNGVIKGPVFARQLLELQPKAQIEGDVEYKTLEMHLGARITGQLRPMLEGEEKPPLKLAANNA
jgi:cytoskeletal protein CcmA (bactofilin family)